MRVVQDNALLTDIELAVFVVGNPRRGRRLNINLWRTVSTLEQGRLLARQGAAVSHDVRVHRRDDAHRQPQAETERPDFAGQAAVGMSNAGGTR